MHPEGCTTRLQPIKCLDCCGFPVAIIIKLFSKSSQDFLMARHRDVGVQNISSLYVNVVEHRYEQGYMHSLLGHDAGISRVELPGILAYVPGLQARPYDENPLS